MNIKNVILINKEGLPFFDNLMICTDTPLTERELKIFTTSLVYLQKYMESKGYASLPFPAVVCFSEKAEIILEHSEDLIMGKCQYFVFYFVNRWRSMNAPDLTMLTVCLEELCHCFFSEFDEDKVKDIVMDVLHVYSPDITRDQAYAGLDDPRRGT